jgi:hypothetical protein
MPDRSFAVHFAQIRSYDNYITANLQLSLLKDHGITCYLKDELTITIDPLLSPAIGGMKLMVVAAEAEKAHQLLDEAEAEYIKTLACTICGQHAIEKITHVENPTSFWGKLKNQLLGGSAVVLKTYYRCGNCGNPFLI